MDLMHNVVISLLGGQREGIYRIVLNESVIGKVVVTRLDHPSTGDISSKQEDGDLTTSTRKNFNLPLLGKLLWIDQIELEQYKQDSSLKIIQVEPEGNLLARSILETDPGIFQQRVQVMQEFLNLESLRESILVDRGISGLVRRATEKHEVSRGLVYKLFSLLCRHGFSEISLHPRFDRCGAPGVHRSCENGRQKAGAKTTKQRIAQKYGEKLPPDQPGMNGRWRLMILAADRSIETPKPSMPERINLIIDKAFVQKFKSDAKGGLIAIEPEQGTYPNRQQIRRVLSTDIPKLERILEQTTKGHFLRSKRGLTGRSWKGVSGPGHTWAIDSTIGDIYLRSSINRSWIIGRPVVYVIVDVWSTAVVGFYVCLTGPSWDMAKLALFSAAISPLLLGQLWGYEPVLTLSPEPTLCTHLLCDRGEYLSRAASVTGMKLLPALSYTPPYRPDLKGIVEVLHRIKKDQQFNFVPGAIDHRRKEFDLRRYDPTLGVFTVSEFTRYLHLTFAEYNLTANRENRLDAHMRADGVFPSPAGLWRWGHETGIGVSRAVSQSELIANLLPSAEATIRRDGVFYGGKNFDSEVVREQDWTTYARNFGSQQIPCHYFPGSVSRIWVPNMRGAGLLELNISDQANASSELTWDEICDVEMYYRINRADHEHIRNMQSINSLQQVKALIKSAQELTAEADLSCLEPRPTIRDARAQEVAGSSQGGTDRQGSASQSGVVSTHVADHAEMMKSILQTIL